MGYCINQRAADFTILKEKTGLALAAVQDLYHQTDKMSGSAGGGGKVVTRHFSWVDMNQLRDAGDLVEAVDAWRWGLSKRSDGAIVGIAFLGEKLGDDLVLFEALAPFVEKGSYIEMDGEDGAVWRWVFDGQTCKEVKAKLVFEE